jgi:uncharacterized coiled-coil DUF342 family protein
MTDQEKIDNLHKILGRKRTEIKQLKQQLAAEQARANQLMPAYARKQCCNKDKGAYDRFERDL